LLVLASGYFYTALMIVPTALTFPGVFAPAGLLGAGLQAGPWIGASSQLGLPLVLIAALLMRESRETNGLSQRSPGQAVALSIALVTTIACGLTWTIIAHQEILPPIFVNNVQLHHNILAVVGPIMALQAIALLLLWRRGRSALDLWLMVLCCAWLFELSLGGIFAGSRYSVGWYSARAFQIGASFIVLLLFLSENTALYANMARAAVQQRGARHARQIAVDAMAASIGHEIGQPLAAVITNADAGVRQAANVKPDMKEVCATFLDIAADGWRIKEIIRDVRTMFKQSSHDRKLLDVNKVVRDVLSSVELDLRLQRVIVKAGLDDGLPPLFADSGQLHQVFLNLITNAMEAMRAVTGRAVVLTLTSGIVEGSSDIAITVEDNGVGIPGLDGDRVFEPFFSTKAGGTGVGLTVCRIIIEAHGGKLQFNANKPYGTVFRVILPGGVCE
jgi:signal transduction histidine kinase